MPVVVVGAGVDKVPTRTYSGSTNPAQTIDCEEKENVMNTIGIIL